MAKPMLRVRIISPQKILLNTIAYSVSSKNSQGTFDILPLHANFITMLENTPIIVRPAVEQVKGQNLEFTFPLAIMLVQNNVVNIYTYIQPKLDKKD